MYCSGSGKGTHSPDDVLNIDNEQGQQILTRQEPWMDMHGPAANNNNAVCVIDDSMRLKSMIIPGCEDTKGDEAANRTLNSNAPMAEYRCDDTRIVMYDCTQSTRDEMSTACWKPNKRLWAAPVVFQ